MSNELLVKNQDDLKSIIHKIRGLKVILDTDLAKIYGYETKTFNQQVKNNKEKFDEDFMFQLTEEEVINLRSKNSTANISNKTRTLPYVFTEQGIYMLMTVLKGELAVKQSKALIRLFKEMKDFISVNQNLISQKDLIKLEVQVAQNKKDVAELKSNMVTKGELANILYEFSNKSTIKDYLILDGEPVEAALAYTEIYSQATKSIYIIDNYIGLKTLSLLKSVSENTAITIFTDNINNGLSNQEYKDFIKEYPDIKLTFKQTKGKYHDRYIVLDYKMPLEKIYHCGASSKDAGKRITTITLISDKETYHALIDDLLINPKLQLK